MKPDTDNIDALRKKLVTLESRSEELSKKLDRLIGKLDKFDPEVNAFMREGLPLEIHTRKVLLDSGFEVHGYFPYHLFNSENSLVERSIDVYASRDYVYTAPEDGGRFAGKSWPERDNLLVESKQRRANVRWLFCNLPTSKKDWSIAGDSVPIVNAGFELRPTETGFQSSGNPKDVKNAIAQLNEAYIPFLVMREDKGRTQPHTGVNPTPGKQSRENTWLLLITNAALRVFRPDASFEELLSDSEAQNDVFREVPWLVFKPELSLHLLAHQKLSIASLVKSRGNEMKSTPEIMSEHTHEVHIIRYDQLHKFLALVKDPPRLKEIKLSLSVNGSEPTSITIK